MANVVKVIVVGEPGVGKSIVINTLVGNKVSEEDFFTVGFSPPPVQQYCINQYGVEVSIWDIDLADFDGMGGPREDEEIVQQLKRSDCFPADLVLFCIRMDTMRIPTRIHTTAMKTLTEVFGEEFWKYSLFILTFANNLEHLCPKWESIELFFAKRKGAIERALLETLKEYTTFTHVPYYCRPYVIGVPVGSGKPGEWALPDGGDWFAYFWMDVGEYMSPSGFSTLLQANYHRLVADCSLFSSNVKPYQRKLCIAPEEIKTLEKKLKEQFGKSFRSEAFQQNELPNPLKQGIQVNDGNLAEAMTKGAGNLRLSNIVFHGPPGAGKSSVKNLILGHPPRPRHAQNATDILEKCVRTVSVSRIATATATPLGKQRFKETSNDDIITRLAGEVEIFRKEHNKTSIKKTKDENPSTMVTGNQNTPTQLQTTRELSNSDETVHNQQPIVIDTQSTDDSSENVEESNQPTATHSTHSHTHIPTTIETWQVLKKNLQDIDSSELPNLFDSRWFHHIDSGGQPQFLDVFPLLYLSPYSHFIVVMRLTEGLDERPKVRFYNEGNDKYMLPDNLVLSNREMITRMCQIAQRVGRATQGKFTPKVIVVGTHQDRLLPIIGRFQQWKINSQLLDIHKKYSDVLVCKVPEEQVMFTVNAMAEEGSEERQRYTEELQECISSATENSDNAFKVPLKWLLLHLELDEGERGVYRISECLELGKKLEMTKEKVSSALKFLNKAALILYYPDDVPDLVLTKVEPLTTRLSKLIKASFIPLANEPTKECDDLREKGVFKKSFLARVFRDMQQQAEISDDEFLALLVCLKIAVNIGDDEYFLPSALSLKPPSTLFYFRSKLSSLALVWDELILPHGFFLTVSVELQDKSAAQNEGGYVFTLCRGNPQWRGEIQLSEAKGQIPGIVKLRDRQQWIEVSYSGDNSYCPTINRVVNSATQRAIKRLRHTGITSPTIGCVCPLCFKKDHYATIAGDGRFVTCSKNERKTGPMTETISCWFKDVSITADVGHTATCSKEEKSIAEVMENVSCSLEGIGNITETTTEEDDQFNQVSPFDVLTSHTPQIMGVVSDTDTLIASLASAGILSSDDVSSINTSTGRFERAKKIMNAVQSCLTKSSNPEEVLLKFSNVLMDQREEGLKDISVKIRGDLVLNKPPMLLDVYEMLNSKASQWDEIGRRLGVTYDYRKQLEQKGTMTSASSKLEDVLHNWLESRCSVVTWRTLFKVLQELQFNDVLESAKKFLKREDILKRYL